ncbi:hypothetical protein [Bacillus swezeyi]|uniref:hypothetical protein n=1 Tax=Bacillus swezeyi TaxID=1925020 RepID=UPI00123A4052|nr:hypothetical protein [Bacillus swezeyi]KAA6482206.1 hypothetical protein DX928_03635 [Bacillus swezeyi]
MSRKMISKFLQDPYKEDFNLYKSYVNQKTQITLLNSYESNIKPLYKKIYYLNFLINHLKLKSTFLKECTYNILLCMDLLNFKFINSMRLQLRSSLEQFNRYLLEKKQQYNPNFGVRQINENVKMHYTGTKIDNIVKDLLNDYKQLCDYVHVTKEQYFSAQRVLNDLEAIKPKEIIQNINLLCRICDYYIISLITLNYSYYSTKIGIYNQRLIESALSIKIDSYIQ